MPLDNSVIDRRLIESLSGADKIRILLKQQAGSISDWARQNGIDPIALHHCLSGRRESSEYRQKIAESLGLDRTVVDSMLDAPAAAA